MTFLVGLKKLDDYGISIGEEKSVDVLGSPLVSSWCTSRENLLLHLWLRQIFHLRSCNSDGENFFTRILAVGLDSKGWEEVADGKAEDWEGGWYADW